MTVTTPVGSETLVERLRVSANVCEFNYNGFATPLAKGDILREAASRIEELEGDLAAYREKRRGERWPDELIAAIDALEDKFDVEMVSIEHHAFWVRKCEAAEASLQSLQRQLEEAREALRPFAEIAPSSFHPGDGSEEEGYIVLLRGNYGNPLAFTGRDLANVRACLAASTLGRVVEGDVISNRTPKNKGEAEPWTPTHSHVDGGLYRILIDNVDGRPSNHEPWTPGLVYEGADGVAWWTSKDRWEDRFRPIEGAE